MKLLRWLLNIQNRYYRQGRRFANGGALSRFISMLILTLLTAASLVLEYFALDLILNQGQIMAILLVVIAFVMIISTIEMNAAYSFFGFKAIKQGAFTGWLEKAASRRGEKKDAAQNNAQITEVEGGEVVDTGAREVPKKKLAPKWLNIFTAVYLLLLTFGEIALVVVVAMI